MIGIFPWNVLAATLLVVTSCLHGVHAFQAVGPTFCRGGNSRISPHSPALLSSPTESSSVDGAFASVVQGRYACKSFQRFDGEVGNQTAASKGDPKVVAMALKCLDLARQAPSAFNTQPYKLLVVESPEKKLAMSQYCLGPNRQRVLDADCSVVFLADRHVLRSIPRLQLFLRSTSGREPNRRMEWITYLYITIFSSGLPLPRAIASLMTFIIRSCVAVIHVFSSRLFHYPLPSLASAETWTSKQATMVAMTYMLACSSCQLATIPMEGINARGIRRVLGIPSRYAIPLVVATGKPREEQPHRTQRYPADEIIFLDSLGQAATV